MIFRVMLQHHYTNGYSELLRELVMKEKGGGGGGKKKKDGQIRGREMFYAMQGCLGEMAQW